MTLYRMETKFNLATAQPGVDNPLSFRLSSKNDSGNWEVVQQHGYDDHAQPPYPGYEFTKGDGIYFSARSETLYGNSEPLTASFSFTPKAGTTSPNPFGISLLEYDSFFSGAGWLIGGNSTTAGQPTFFSFKNTGTYDMGFSVSILQRKFAFDPEWKVSGDGFGPPKSGQSPGRS